MQTITVCTDAGHKNYFKQSVAVWATYIRTPDQTIHSSGIISQHVKGSSHAELYALANALHIVNRNYDLTKYRLIVYSDNLYALQNHIDNTLNPNRGQDHIDVYEKHIRPIVSKPLNFEARHVKGHLPRSEWGPSPVRFYMQDWCDKEVKRMMKVGIELVQQKMQQNKLVFSKEKEHN